MKIGLIGDYDKNITAHQAIPEAFKLIQDKLQLNFTYEWIGTEKIEDSSSLTQFNGLWCVPGSPYRSMQGALTAIQYARENKVPFLGTCGGFQHAIIEYARNVIGLRNAGHSESEPETACPIVNQLVCPLVEQKCNVYLIDGTKIAVSYGLNNIEENYNCSFGLNQEYEKVVIKYPLQVSALDDSSNVRAVELVNDHPFFVAALFQPERIALRGIIPPLVMTFIQAVAAINKAI